jgi:hypothetical protein
MLTLLMLCLFALFGGLWLFFAMLWGIFRIGFWVLGGLLHLIFGGVALLICAVLALALLPLAGLLMIPFAFPVLLVAGLAWLLLRSPRRPAPVIIRR